MQGSPCPFVGPNIEAERRSTESRKFASNRATRRTFTGVLPSRLTFIERSTDSEIVFAQRLLDQETESLPLQKPHQVYARAGQASLGDVGVMRPQHQPATRPFLPQSPGEVLKHRGFTRLPDQCEVHGSDLFSSLCAGNIGTICGV